MCSDYRTDVVNQRFFHAQRMQPLFQIPYVADTVAVTDKYRLIGKVYAEFLRLFRQTLDGTAAATRLSTLIRRPRLSTCMTGLIPNMEPTTATAADTRPPRFK